MNKRIFLIILTLAALSLITQTAFTQETPIIIKGSVRDSRTDQPLSSAHVMIKGTRTSTITNDDGNFQIEIHELPAEIAVSFIGYESLEKSVVSDTTETIDFLLEPRLYVLPTVVVTAGNTAETIMRRVIARKLEWTESLYTFRADAYTRINLSNGKKIAFISESVSELFWDKEQGTREVTTFTKNTENVPADLAIASARMAPNFYDDNVDLFGYNLVGLTNSDALDYYTFEIIDYSMLDNKTVYIMSVEPKSKLQPLFRGTVSILDEDYAMIDLDLSPNEAVIYPAPLNDFNFTVKQQFSNFGEEIWLPVDVRVSGSIKIKLGILLEMPQINYSQVSHFSDYDINIALPDSLYKTDSIRTLSISVGDGGGGIRVMDVESDPEQDIVTEPADEESQDSADNVAINVAADTLSVAAMELSVADSLAVLALEEARKDSLFALNRSAIPFSEEEEKAYAEIDSTMTLEKVFKPTGLLVKLAGDIDEDDSTQQDSDREQKEKTWFGKTIDRATAGMSYSFWHNRVDGFHVGLNWEKNYKRRLRYNFGSAYKKALDRWSWNARTEVFFSDKRRTSFILSAFSGTDTRQSTVYYPVAINSLLTFGGKGDYFDYFWNDRYSAGIKYRFSRNNMEIETTFNAERHESLPGSNYFDITGKRQALRANPAVKEGDLRSISLKFKFGEDIIPLAVEGLKGSAFSIEHAAPDFLGGIHGFTRFDADILLRVDTYLKRRLFPMTLDIRLVGSASTGKLPVARFPSLDSRFLAWTPFGAFRSLGLRPLEGEHLAGIFAEHNFRTVPFELIGLRSVADRNIGIILHGAAGRTWISSDRLKELAFTPNFKDSLISEAGISVNNLFGFIRLDYTKRLDRHGYTIGINIARIM